MNSNMGGNITHEMLKDAERAQTRKALLVGFQTTARTAESGLRLFLTAISTPNPSFCKSLMFFLEVALRAGQKQTEDPSKKGPVSQGIDPWSLPIASFLIRCPLFMPTH